MICCIVKTEEYKSFAGRIQCYKLLFSIAVSEVARRLNIIKTDEEADALMVEYGDFLIDETVVDEDKVAEFWSRSTGETFPYLTRLVRALMTFPHSNVASERLFSMLKKINTDQQSNLSKETVNALLSFKVNNQQCCSDQMFDTARLKKLKRATHMYNERHKSENTADNSDNPQSGSSN